MGMLAITACKDASDRTVAAPHAGSFAALLGPLAWARLPEAIRRRFMRHPAASGSFAYVGEIAEMRISRLGCALAWLARLIGGPLPLHRDVGVPATVIVTAHRASGGQIWTRLYGRAAALPQAIHSVKRFAGPTGLEEYLGCGFGIALRLEATSDALLFHGDHYFIQLGALRWRLPGLLSPGHLTIGHHELGGGHFAFTLDLAHPLLGELMHQRAVFGDAGPA